MSSVEAAGLDMPAAAARRRLEAPYQTEVPAPAEKDLGGPMSKGKAIQEGQAWWSDVQERKLEESLRRRLRRREWAEAGGKRRRATLEACRADVTQWINDWVWTYDPRNVDRGLPAHIPFELRPRQVDLTRWIEALISTRSNGLVEKSRDEGLTYCVAAVFLHKWIFRPGFKAGIGSRKQALVDDLGNLDAILPKIRQILEGLPAWMLPDGFELGGEHDNFLRVKNPQTGASITGEAGDNIGRGGRNTAYFVDEHASISRPKKVERALSQNTNCIIYGSTPKGPGNLFYEKRHSGEIPVFTLHWRDNPAKNYKAHYLPSGPREGQQTIRPWYEAEKEEYDAVTIAQEVDIDYSASSERAVIPGAWVQAAVEIELDAGGAAPKGGLDVAGEGDDSTVYTARRGPALQRIEEVRLSNVGAAADTVGRYCREDNLKWLLYDRLGVGSGITATLYRAAEEGKVEAAVIGVANSGDPSEDPLGDRPDTPATDRFRYWADEQWWRLRLRFQRTYQRVQHAGDARDARCISIPNRASLIAQLSQPQYMKTSSGLIKVDKTGEGSGSPDEAESLLYAFAEPKRRPPETIDWGNPEEIRL